MFVGHGIKPVILQRKSSNLFDLKNFLATNTMIVTIDKATGNVANINNFKLESF